MQENPKAEACSADVAGGCTHPGRPTTSGLAECPDACLAVVTRGAQHGGGMADPPQSPTGPRQHADPGQAELGDLRPPGSGNRRHEGEPCEAERLASLGQPSRDRRQPLHPQAEPQLVEPAAPHGPVSTDNVLHLLEHQHYRCALTGRRLTPETAALDHIVPVRRGGQHVIENTQVLHKDVNRAKGSLTSEEFLAMCHEVVRWSH